MYFHTQSLYILVINSPMHNEMEVQFCCFHLSLDQIICCCTNVIRPWVGYAALGVNYEFVSYEYLDALQIVLGMIYEYCNSWIFWFTTNFFIFSSFDPWFDRCDSAQSRCETRSTWPQPYGHVRYSICGSVFIPVRSYHPCCNVGVICLSNIARQPR